MSRRAATLVALVSIAIAVVALVVIADRQDDDGILVAPTAMPSPSFGPAATPPPFATPEPSDPSDPADTPTLTESPTGPAQEETPEPVGPTPTPFVVPTPTPSPDTTPLPNPDVDTPDGPTPITGGGAMTGGLLVLLSSGLVRAIATRLR